MKYSLTLALAAATLTNALPQLLQQLQCSVYSVGVNPLKVASVSTSVQSYCSTLLAVTTTTTTTVTSTALLTSTTTLPVTASASVTTTLPAPTATQTVYSNCGINGYDRQNPAAYSVTGNTGDGTYAGCSALCAASTQCQSFGVGSGTCLLYAARTANNVNPVASSPYSFYDATCPAPAAAVAKRTVSLTTGIGGLSLLSAADQKNACQCFISAPLTITKVVSALQTITQTVPVTSTVTVATTTNTISITPAAVTVTVTTTA